MAKPMPSHALRPVSIWTRSAVVAVIGAAFAYLVSVGLGSPLLPSMLTAFVFLPLLIASVAAHRLPLVRSALERRQLDRARGRTAIGPVAEDEPNRSFGG